MAGKVSPNSSEVNHGKAFIVSSNIKGGDIYKVLNHLKDIQSDIEKEEKDEIISTVKNSKNVYEIIFNKNLNDKREVPLHLTELIYEQDLFLDSFAFKRFDNIFKSILPFLVNHDNELIFSDNSRSDINFIHEYDGYNFTCNIRFYNLYGKRGEIIGRQIQIRLTNDGFLYRDLKTFEFEDPDVWHQAKNWKQLKNNVIEEFKVINDYLLYFRKKFKEDSDFQEYYYFHAEKNRFDISLEDGYDLLLIAFENKYPESTNRRRPARDWRKKDINLPSIDDIKKLYE